MAVFAFKSLLLLMNFPLSRSQSFQRFAIFINLVKEPIFGFTYYPHHVCVLLFHYSLFFIFPLLSFALGLFNSSSGWLAINFRPFLKETDTGHYYCYFKQLWLPWKQKSSNCKKHDSQGAQPICSNLSRPWCGGHASSGGGLHAGFTEPVRCSVTPSLLSLLSLGVRAATVRSLPPVPPTSQFISRNTIFCHLIPSNKILAHLIPFASWMNSENIMLTERSQI